MRTTLAILLATSLAAACGSGEPAFPDESTMQIESPDGSGEQPLCVTGDDTYKLILKRELDELNDASRPYVALYKLARGAAKASAKADGKVERKGSGPKGSATITAEQLDDGSTTIRITAALKGHEDNERLLMEGTVAADALSGTWKIFGKDGVVVRSVTWSRTESGDIVARWKNEKNGKVADYTRTGTAAVYKLTNPGGAAFEIKWDTQTKVGDAAVINASGEVTAHKCWDANLCNAECP